MAAPLAFALAAPVTLLLRAGGPRARRRLVALLHSHVVRWVGWAPVGASVSVGSMWALYLTPLYAATLAHPALHDLVHLHMLVAGCLLTFPLVGRDPLPGRGGWHLRVAVLFAVLAAHAVLATYLYVHATSLSAPGVGTAADWRAGAQILWYGGDAVDALLLTAFFATWYRAAGRRAGRAGRTSGVRAAAAPAATAACHDRRRSRRSAGTPT
jgi:putative membrane protein